MNLDVQRYRVEYFSQEHGFWRIDVFAGLLNLDLAREYAQGWRDCGVKARIRASEYWRMCYLADRRKRQHDVIVAMTWQEAEAKAHNEAEARIDEWEAKEREKHEKTLCMECGKPVPEHWRTWCDDCEKAQEEEDKAQEEYARDIMTCCGNPREWGHASYCLLFDQ